MLIAPSLLRGDALLRQASIPQLEIIYQWHDENHHHFFGTPDGKLCCISRSLADYRIMHDLKLLTCGNVWCYSSLALATCALVVWAENFDTMSEPDGWYRHPRSGRRVYQTWCEVRP